MLGISSLNLILSDRGASYEDSAVRPATVPVRAGLGSSPLAPLSLEQASQRPSTAGVRVEARRRLPHKT